MEMIIKDSTMVEYAVQFMDILDEGFVTSMAYDIIQERVRNEQDGDIWEMVDSEENTLELDFDDFLDEVMDSIVSRVDYYLTNNAAK